MPDDLAIGTTKKVLQGRAGTYIWESVTFRRDLAKFAWSAKAPSKACSTKWIFEPSYMDGVSRTLKAAERTTKSASKTVEVNSDTGVLTVVGTCPSWSLALTSTTKPAYWNPWGYNFTPGRRIYNPPFDFCSYFNCINNFGNSAGYVIQCRDSTFSTAGGRQGACSWHGGLRRALYKH